MGTYFIMPGIYTALMRQPGQSDKAWRAKKRQQQIQHNKLERMRRREAMRRNAHYWPNTLAFMEATKWSR